MRKLKNLIPRNRGLLTAAALTALLLGALIHFSGGSGGEKSPPEPGQSQHPDPTATAAKTSETAEKQDGAVQWSEEELANGMRPFKPGQYHPWLTLLKSQMGFRYSGPQTAEAIAAIFYWAPQWQGEKRAELLAHLQRVIDRGAVFQDDWDAYEYGNSIMSRLSRRRELLAEKGPKEFFAQYGLPETASIEEVENRLIDGHLQYWPIAKGQFYHASETGEGTLNVRLDPENSSIFIKAIGKGGKPPLTDVEKYNISRHGVAPKGYRLRFIGKSFSEELPLSEVPFFSERKYVKDLKDADLSELLTAIPAYLSQPDAVEQSDVLLLSMVDRYEAALNELAARNNIPKPFAGREAASAAPSAQARSSAAPPNLETAAEPFARGGPIGPPPRNPQDEAAAAEAERERRIAEIFLQELEKAAKKGGMDEAARPLIAARIRDLRIMRNPEILNPVPRQTEPAASGQNGGEDEEEKSGP